MNKMELKEKLTDHMVDTERAEQIAEIIDILDNNTFDEMYYELEEEKNLDYCFLAMDNSITAIVDYLEGLTIDDIRTQFNGYYSYDYIIASEDGRGFVFIEA